MLAGCANETEERVWKTAGITTRDIVVSVQAAGIIEPVTTVEIKSKASGEILEILADTGDIVEAGDLLVQIDKRTPRNSLSQAQAELEAARARRDIAKTQRERAEKLYASGTLNQVDHEQSILEYANSKAEVVRSQVSVENARIALDDTEVRSPINGTLIQRDVEQGQVISSPTMDVGGGTALLKMADLRSVQVRSLVDESDIGKIQPNQIAMVTVAAYPNQPFEGIVLKIEPKAEDEEAVTLFAVIVTIENEKGLLKPGMNAEVEVDIASRRGVPAIPTIALRTLADIKAAAMFTAIDEQSIRQRLGDSGMPAEEASNDEDGSDTNGPVPAASPPPQAQADRQLSSSGRPATDSEPLGQQGYLFGGDYWVFVMRDDTPIATNVVTGLTDLDYSEIVSGIDASDHILLLPSSDLILSQDRFKQFMGQMGGVPGISKSQDN